MKKVIVAVMVMLFWCNVGFAGGREEASKALSRRLIHGLEAFILAGCFIVIAFLFAKLIKALFKVNIESKYYYIIVMGVGVVSTNYFFK